MINYYRGKSLSFEKGKEKFDSQSGLEEFTFVSEFTFEDWISNEIPPPPCIYWMKIGRPNGLWAKRWRDTWEDYWYRQEPGLNKFHKDSLLTFAEHKKIKEEKKRLYKLAIELKSSSMIYTLRRKLKSISPAIQREDLLQHELEKYKGIISDELKESIWNGDTNHEIICPITRESILMVKKLRDDGLKELSADVKVENGRNYKISYIKVDEPLFHAYVFYKYFGELKKINEIGISEYLSDNKREKGNALKLDVAKNWMDPLVERITNLSSGREKLQSSDVTKLLEEVYPTFTEEFDFSKLGKSFIKNGNTLNKTSIAKAIIFIFKKKHGETRSVSAIKKRYEHPRFDYW